MLEQFTAQKLQFAKYDHNFTKITFRRMIPLSANNCDLLIPKMSCYRHSP